MTACTPRAPSASAPAAAPVEITVVHEAGADAWTITYRLPEKTRALGFARSTYAYRGDWQVTEPAGAVMRTDAEADHVVAPAPFDTLVLRIPSYFKRVEKDYELFYRYTDGGTSVYTGHFDVLPVACLDTACTKIAATPEVPPATRFVFAPRAGEWVVTPAGTAQGRSEWNAQGETSYVYFGTMPPSDYGTFTAVIDPGFPAWLRAELVPLLPRLMTYYAEKTAQTLPWHPRIFLSYSDASEPGAISITGGTQESLVQFAIEIGSSKRKPGDADVHNVAQEILAHEIAHLWNAKAFANAGGDWLHEGGADAFAFRALRDLGLITAAQYKERLSTDLSLCLFNLSGTALKDSSKPGKFKNYYWCGSTLELWAESALREQRADLDLFSVWREVFSESTQHRYDASTYFSALEHLELQKQLPGMKRAVEEVVSEDWLIDRLREAGVALTAHAFTDDLPYDYQALALRKAAAALAVPPALKAVSVEGIPRKEGAKIYDAVVKKCAAQEAVVVKSASESLSLRCTSPLAPRPHFYDVH